MCKYDKVYKICQVSNICTFFEKCCKKRLGFLNTKYFTILRKRDFAWYVYARKYFVFSYAIPNSSNNTISLPVCVWEQLFEKEASAFQVSQGCMHQFNERWETYRTWLDSQIPFPFSYFLRYMDICGTKFMKR